MSIWRWFRPETRPEDRLYAAIVAAARRPRPYAEWRVPDTVDGRFEMVVLHLALVVARLKQAGHDGFILSLVERFVTDMDDALRELGSADVTVGKKVRKMAEAFYGRAAVYEAAGDDTAALAAALARNIWPDAPPPAAATDLARAVLTARRALAAQDDVAMTHGEVTFP